MKKIYSLLSILIFASPALWAANRTAKENYALQAAENASVSVDTVFWALAVLGLILLFAIIWAASSIKEMISSESLMQKIKESRKLSPIALIALALPFISAADPNGASSFVSWDGVYVLAVLDFVLLAIFFYLISIIRESLSSVLPKKEKAVAVVKDERLIKFGIKEKWSGKWILQKLTNAVPVEHEEEVMTDHNYDGIIELDNSLPPWWLYGFYVSIAFGIFYFLYYTAFGIGNTTVENMKEEYAVAAVEEAKRKALNPGGVNEENVIYAPTAERIANGKEIFLGKGQCATCHKADGGGSVGVNLTDDHWIYGASIRDLFYTIKFGRNGKGNMPSQDGKLSPEEIQDVSTYVLSLEPAIDGKGPEGEVWNGEQPTAEDTAE